MGCSRILQFDELAEESAELSTAPLGVDRLLSRVCILGRFEEHF